MNSSPPTDPLSCPPKKRGFARFAPTKWRLLLAAFLTVAIALDAAAETAAPADVVEDFHESLLSVMKEAETLGVKGRYDRLSAPVKKAFDLGRMIRVASNPHWKSSGDSKQADLLDAFSRMSVATYAAQFSGFSGQRFETGETRPGPQGTTLVATRIVEESGSGVGLTYVMKESGGKWLIADVLLDDKISQLAVRRSEYRRILKTQGVDGLIKSLNETTEKLLAE